MTALGLLLFPALLAQQPAQTYEERYREILNVEPRADRAATVSDLVLTRDVAQFTLTSGTLHLLSAVGGRTIGAVFRGAGTFRFEPPTQIERDRLKAFEGTEALDNPFTELVLFFADSTGAELERRLTFGTARPAGGFEDVVTNSLRFLSNDDIKSFEPDLMAAFLNGDTNDLFYAHIERRRGGAVMFMLNPHEVEEITLGKRAPNWTRLLEPEVICRFPRRQVIHTETTGNRRSTAVISDYKIAVTLTPGAGADLTFAAKAQLTITANAPVGPWVTFNLYPELIVDGATLAEGSPAGVFRGRHEGRAMLLRNWPLWIRLPRRLQPGEQIPVTLSYHGDLIDRFADFFLIKSSIAWYPLSLEGRTYATFDNTFHVPSHYRLASVGTRTDSSVTDRVLTTRWVTTDPIRNASFAVGPLDDYRVHEEGVPPVSVMLSEQMHREIASGMLAETREYMDDGVRDTRAQMLPQSRIKETVGQDVVQSLKFFQRQYGPPPAPRLVATEIPAFHGEAFPGLVHLSFTTFLFTDPMGRDEVFRAHEVAHQWWGIGVDFDTYHDQWLSEGLANFSGLWYLHAARRGSAKYFDILRKWRNDIVVRRDEPTPISLGYRTQSSKDPTGYSILVYQKGAWVMHMLRALMLDLNTVKEDRFTAMMQDFYQTYRGKRASTLDFQRVVETHRGSRMDWFFNQWVDGWRIPTYRVAYRKERGADDQYRVSLRVDQTDVPEDFQMPVLVTIELKDKRQGRYRINVRGPRTEVTLPPLPAEPLTVKFNDLESVLADVKMVAW